MILQVEGKGKREGIQGNDGSLNRDETLHLARPWADPGDPLLRPSMFQCSMGGAERTVGPKGVLRVGMRDNSAVNSSCLIT